MWASVGRECFMEVVRFELSLEEFESRDSFGSVSIRKLQWQKDGDNKGTGLMYYLGSICSCSFLVSFSVIDRGIQSSIVLVTGS